MYRRILVSLAVLGILTVTGCTGGPPLTDETTYYVEGQIVEEVPENRTVIGYKNATVKDIDALQKVVRQTVTHNESTQVSVSEETYRRIQDTYENLPTYRWNAETHIYIQYDGTVVAVNYDMNAPGG